ncbi:MAG: PDZ domain-containing protein [Deltaproteobacteria bacterium]|nr:PDZ domain-containing protein [Deltaproteobacteria bacterium]
MLLVLVAALAALAANLWAAPDEHYEALRLASEAFYEISHKHVTPKSEAEMIEGALRGMMNSLDPDSSYLTPAEYRELQKGNLRPAADAGMELVFKDNFLTVVSVQDGGPAFRAGIRPGDHIIKINGQLIRNLTTQEGIRRFQGNPGTKIKVMVLRNGLIKPLDLEVTLAPPRPPRVTRQMLADNLLYVRVAGFTNDTPAELATVLKEAQHRRPPVTGVILDLRNNARGSLEQAVRTASLFVGAKKIVSTKGRKLVTEQHFYGKERDKLFKSNLPLVVLVDQGTARAAEIVAAALKSHARATLLGTKTFGLCGITRVLPLKDGSALIMTVAHCYTPQGKKITGNGLTPDVEGKEAKPAALRPVGAPWPPPEKDPWVKQAIDLIKKGARGAWLGEPRRFWQDDGTAAKS